MPIATLELKNIPLVDATRKKESFSSMETISSCSNAEYKQTKKLFANETTTKVLKENIISTWETGFNTEERDTLWQNGSERIDVFSNNKLIQKFQSHSRK